MKKLSVLLLLICAACCICLLVACDSTPAVTDPCANGHTAVTDAEIPATCTQAGMTEGAHCSVCNKVLTAQTPIAPLSHTAGEWIEQLPATCTQKGTRYNTCTVCNTVMSVETVAELGHSFTAWRTTKAATCSAKGVETRSCNSCALTETRDVKERAHLSGSRIVDVVPNCTTAGSAHYSCVTCGALLKQEALAKTAHDYADWITALAASCTQAGRRTASCKHCGDVKEETLSRLPHTEIWIDDLASTCTTNGIRHKECSVCHTVLKTDTTSAFGHEYPRDTSEWTLLSAASCTAQGLIKATCAHCGLEKFETLPALSHQGSWVNVTAASCTVEGQRRMNCTVCETVVIQAIQARGHRFGEWETQSAPTCQTLGIQTRTCLVCADTETQTLDRLPHKESDWLTDAVTAPTCTADGRRYKLCTLCNTITVTEEVEALGHDLGAWETQSTPTCQALGTKLRACRRCTFAETQSIDRTSHVAGEWITDAATSCAVGGQRRKLCTLCNAVMETQELAVGEHDFGAWETQSAPTCQTLGTKIRTCLICHDVQTQSIDRVAHAPSEWITDIPVTCAAYGSKHVECTLCGSILQTEIITDLLAHVGGDQWNVVTMPTATAAGTSVKGCIRCGLGTQSAATRLEYGSVVAIEQAVSLSLSGYSIVYKAPTKTSTDFFTTHLDRLCAVMKTATGKNFTACADTAATATKKEILIGLTDRAESAQAYATLSGNAFTVRVVNDKIVILGTSEMLTLTALQYFLNEVIGSASTVEISFDATARDLVAKPLVGSASSDFVYVMDDDLDRDPLHMYVGTSAVPTGDGRDYPVYLFEKLMAQIASRTSIGISNLLRCTDAITAHKDGYEVLFGEIDRAESRAFRDKLLANEYGFAVWGKKVIITAHTDAGLEKALAAFLAFYDELLANHAGILPQGYTFLDAVTDQGWIADFPAPDGVTIYNAQSNNDKSIQIIYTGAGASADGFLAYCQKLEAAGYTVVQANDDLTKTGSYFRLYQNTATKHVLYVAYNAFSAQKDYADVFAAEELEGTQFGDFIHFSKPNSYNVYYPMRTYEQCLRVVSAPLTTAYLPDSKLLTQQAYSKICNSSVTTIRLVGNSVGMSYILQLEDGSFVIVDGGNYVKDNYDKEILYATLTELHTRAHGAAPTPSKPIHIAAWLVTHSHGDHYGNMNAFLSTYASSKLIKMDYLIGNFPDLSTIYPVGGDTTWMGNGTNIPNMQKYFTDAGLSAFKYVKVHTGMALYFANLKMEILMTTEDHAPFRITNSNDTNTVTKWTISSTPAQSGSISADTVSDAKSTTWTMLGDSCVYASRWLCAMWGGAYDATTGLYDGGYLKADMVQLAHHGNIGCEVALYKTVQPEVVWFPHNSSSYNSYTQNGTDVWTRHVDSYVIKTLPTVKYIVVSGMNSSSYTNSVTISFNENGIYFPEHGAENPAWGIKYNNTTGNYTSVEIAYNTHLSMYDITRAYNSPVISKIPVDLTEE